MKPSKLTTPAGQAYLIRKHAAAKSKPSPDFIVVGRDIVPPTLKLVGVMNFGSSSRETVRDDAFLAEQVLLETATHGFFFASVK